MKLNDPLTWDSVWQGDLLGESDGVRWLCLPMIFNHRLIGVVNDYDAFGATWGWCFASREQALESFRAWDPETEDEPLGWHKRVTGPVRQAPELLLNPEHNLSRCRHGSYLDTEKCAVADVCDDFISRRRGF